jgi:transposase-like protein
MNQLAFATSIPTSNTRPGSKPFTSARNAAARAPPTCPEKPSTSPPPSSPTVTTDGAESITHEQVQRYQLRTGAFFPSLLARRRRIDQALFAVVMEAYVTGTSTRKVDELVVAMGADTGISKSEVSRICADLDVEVAAFRDRSLAESAFPYVFLDACFCKARNGGDRRGRGSRVAAQAVVIATGVSADRRREVLGFDASRPRTPITRALRSLGAGLAAAICVLCG